MNPPSNGQQVTFGTTVLVLTQNILIVASKRLFSDDVISTYITWPKCLNLAFFLGIIFSIAHCYDQQLPVSQLPITIFRPYIHLGKWVSPT
uniref:Uncharacterized protein n=1 Tax=Arundo donax TaxID=35708 RepID=A0A0A9DZW3_ARUDO